MISRIAAGSLHHWKGVSRTPPFARAAQFAKTAQFATCEKDDTYERLCSLNREKLDRIIREEMESGVSITPPVLECWAKRLSKDGKHEDAHEVYEFMKTNLKYSREKVDPATKNILFGRRIHMNLRRKWDDDKP